MRCIFGKDSSCKDLTVIHAKISDFKSPFAERNFSNEENIQWPHQDMRKIWCFDTHTDSPLSTCLEPTIWFVRKYQVWKLWKCRPHHYSTTQYSTSGKAATRGVSWWKCLLKSCFCQFFCTRITQNHYSEPRSIEFCSTISKVWHHIHVKMGF